MVDMISISSIWFLKRGKNTGHCFHIKYGEIIATNVSTFSLNNSISIVIEILRLISLFVFLKENNSVSNSANDQLAAANR